LINTQQLYVVSIKEVKSEPKYGIRA
jgi:hypothetical protein